MAMGGQSKKVIYELLGAFVVIMLLVVLRPLFVGQVATASAPYTVDYGNGTTETVTPTSTLSVSQTNTIYSVVIFIVALIALVAILLTIAGKI